MLKSALKFRGFMLCFCGRRISYKITKVPYNRLIRALFKF